jgi:hypothetical protein
MVCWFRGQTRELKRGFKLERDGTVTSHVSRDGEVLTETRRKAHAPSQLVFTNHGGGRALAARPAAFRLAGMKDTIPGVYVPAEGFEI